MKTLTTFLMGSAWRVITIGIVGYWLLATHLKPLADPAPFLGYQILVLLSVGGLSYFAGRWILAFAYLFVGSPKLFLVMFYLGVISNLIGIAEIQMASILGDDVFVQIPSTLAITIVAKNYYLEERGPKKQSEMVRS